MFMYKLIFFLISLVQRHLSATSVLRNSVRMHTNLTSQVQQDSAESALKQKLIGAANKASALLRQGKVPKLTDDNLLNKLEYLESNKNSSNETDGLTNCLYSVTASFTGFVVSFIDTVPSEIAVVSIRKLAFMAQWDHNRVSEATAAISIGWLQIDNQCPNAPFPVALSPSSPEEETIGDFSQDEKPFFSVGVVVAPRHKSNIMVCMCILLCLSMYQYLR